MLSGIDKGKKGGADVGTVEQGENKGNTDNKDWSKEEITPDKAHRMKEQKGVTPSTVRAKLSPTAKQFKPGMREVA
eukprot:478467-Rhodomonas_salina.3